MYVLSSNLLPKQQVSCCGRDNNWTNWMHSSFLVKKVVSCIKSPVIITMAWFRKQNGVHMQMAIVYLGNSFISPLSFQEQQGWGKMICKTLILLKQLHISWLGSERNTVRNRIINWRLLIRNAYNFITTGFRVSIAGNVLARLRTKPINQIIILK